MRWTRGYGSDVGCRSLGCHLDEVRIRSAVQTRSQPLPCTEAGGDKWCYSWCYRRDEQPWGLEFGIVTKAAQIESVFDRFEKPNVVEA